MLTVRNRSWQKIFESASALSKMQKNFEVLPPNYATEGESAVGKISDNTNHGFNHIPGKYSKYL